jgi:hypothetical protein
MNSTATTSLSQMFHGKFSHSQPPLLQQIQIDVTSHYQTILKIYCIFPSITRTLCITCTQYFPFSRTFLIDTAHLMYTTHLKIHGIVRLAVARPVFRYFTPLGPRKCAPPPYLFVFSYVYAKKHRKLTKDKTL